MCIRDSTCAGRLMVGPRNVSSCPERNCTNTLDMLEFSIPLSDNSSLARFSASAARRCLFADGFGTCVAMGLSRCGSVVYAYKPDTNFFLDCNVMNTDVCGCACVCVCVWSFRVHVMKKFWMCSRSQARASFDALLLHMTAAMGTAAREGDLKVCVREATCKVQCAA